MTKFPPSTSAHKGAALRQSVVEGDARKAWINYWGADAWRDEVKEGVRKWETNFSGGVNILIGEGVDVGDLTSIVGHKKKIAYLALDV